MKNVNYLLLTGILFLGCNKQYQDDMSLSDIKSAYAKVEFLNQLLQNGEDTDEPDVEFLGVDARNGLPINQKLTDRCGGCILYLQYELILEGINEDECAGQDKVSIIDYCGIVGTPTYMGCQPDTTE